ncbi:biotin--[acetyl-CoA-carboxylase] ligase [Winogradskyella sp. DF17]|uniref:Biotin--[acetyl-CoA-carboxylase] ligase n=1 Tax=Winogradskyella pelagia TaxID=2819984 RepID=A0ABS3T664_9FLAO|nr:biotin--[acetyl-CoA-carboxylase] ligase [Winogradskyella sp. DF17]MBO3117205.1 biotin--[acetyl-CoA-carboxylase] ligase [Winogradskyella sp. DF17]
MFIIKLDAIDSTNSYLRRTASVSIPKDYTVVWSEFQTQGRGQMGAHWQSEEGKNLTFSMFKRNTEFDIDDRFVISMLVSLGIFKSLKKFQLPRLAIKWPNDILSEELKICGILIENIIKNNQLVGSVIGIGLNVNQRFFHNLPSATSMHLLTGKLHEKEELLAEIVTSIKIQFENAKSKTIEEITEEYESLLFRLDKPSTFKIAGEKVFSGIIRGVTPSGRLKVWLEDQDIKTFDFKEITLLY